MLRKGRTWIRRRINSSRFGVSFHRSRDARLPARIRLAEDTIELCSPPEPGIHADFVTIFLDDCYRLLEMRLRPGARIIDIGANIGLFSIAARMRFPDAVIHAYEPNPRLATFIQSHARQAKFDYFPEAITARGGRVRLVDGGDSNVATTIAADDSGIASTSFNDAIARAGSRIDLVKLDCEGAEWPLLEDDSLWACVDNITMEYHLWAAKEVTHESISRRLEHLGFEIVNCVREPTTGTLWARRR